MHLVANSAKLPQTSAFASAQERERPRFATSYKVRENKLSRIGRSRYESKKRSEGKVPRAIPRIDFLHYNDAFPGGGNNYFHTDAHSHHLKVGDVCNSIGYSVSPPASTGTSRLNKLCFTDDMSSCIAAAIGGVSPDRKKAKIRVFHFLASSANESSAVVKGHIGTLRSQGFTSVTAALHGGFWSESEVESSSAPISSNYLAQRLRSTFHEQSVNVVLDEACDRRTRETPLGAVIVPGARDGEVQVKFVTHITSDHLPDRDVLRLYKEEEEEED